MGTVTPKQSSAEKGLIRRLQTRPNARPCGTCAEEAIWRTERQTCRVASSTAQDDSYQPFPESDSLRANLDLDRSELRHRIGAIRGTVYCYVVRTVVYAGAQLVQTGSAPNFQGGLITLCTCKHQMRAGRPVDAWRGVWVAGFTGTGTGRDVRNHLFYLMRVEHAFTSHRDLWARLDAIAPRAAEAKAANQHRLGDVYRPQVPCEDPFDPDAYISPCENHVHSGGQRWYKDIDYIAVKFGRRPALLVGDPGYSFLWSTPCISVPTQAQVGRGVKKVDLEVLLGGLGEASAQ